MGFEGGRGPTGGDVMRVEWRMICKLLAEI